MAELLSALLLEVLDFGPALLPCPVIPSVCVLTSDCFVDGPIPSHPVQLPSTSCTGVCLAITMLQYYICLGIVLTVILVLGLGLGFGISLYFVIGT